MSIFNSGIDRRLRANNAINHQQALKCPRCESLNTKFCYYNNYNLSQPRFYCKACRRYWTKGGVLRNVPVGGGIRKAKRSSKTKKSNTSEAVADAEAAVTKSDSNSSSERSGLTATTTTAATEVVSCPNMFSFATESPFIVPQITEPSFDNQNLIDPDISAGSMFTEDIGRFTHMMTSSTALGYNIAESSTYRSDNQNDDQVQQMNNNTRAGYLDQTTQIELKETEIKMSNGGFTGVEWHVADHSDGGIFDLTGNVDEAYWSQSQWPQHSDHSFNFHLP